MKKAAQATPNLRLSRAREQRGWSQQEVADQIGTTPVNISRWERGITVPSPYFRHKLCDLFGKDAQDLGLVGDGADNRSELLPAETAADRARAIRIPPVAVPLWNIPHRRNPFFTGREEVLKRLHTTLAASRTAALTQPQAISGLGGIGKTHTALEYAYRFRDEYQAVFWARADSHETLVSDLAAIASLLQLPEQNEQEQLRVVEAVRRWLSEHDRWLLILDNVDDIELVNDVLPTMSIGHIVLTTRARATGMIAQDIELEQMEPEEGALFLLRRAKIVASDLPLDNASYADWAKAKAIAQAQGGLPLALDQAGAYIEETGCSLSSYLNLYTARRSQLLKRRGRLTFDHPEPVATTWSLSFEKVAQANPAAADLLRLCVFLHPDAIPEEIFTAGSPELGPLLGPVAADPMELDAAIGELRKYSLVRRHPDTHTLTIHRLVQAVLTDQMDEHMQRQWVERVVRAVSRAFPAGEFANWQRCQRLFPHALACAALIEQWSLAFPEAAQLLDQAGSYLRERAQYKEAEPLLKRALAIYEQSLEAQHSDMARCLNDLATLYWNQGKYEQAESLFQQALTIREQTLGLEHPDVASSLNNLALLYWNQGKYEQAEPLYHRALAIREQVLGLGHADVAQTLNNLGILYLAQGRYAQAEPLLKRALAVWEQALGPTHPDVAFSLHNLAFLYYNLGNYAQAEPLFQRALAIREQALGPKHNEVAYTLDNLAVVYGAQGKYEQAELLFQRALTIREQVLGQGHPLVAQTLNHLAQLYSAQGKYAQAGPLLTRSEAIREQALGPEHPDVAFSLTDLALVNCAQGNYEQAESLLVRALTIREQALGPGNPHVVSTLKHYVALLRKMNREAEAAEVEARARSIRATSTTTQ